MGAVLTCLQGACCGASWLGSAVRGALSVTKGIRDISKTDSQTVSSPLKANLMELGLFLFSSFLAWAMTLDIFQKDINGWIRWKFTCDDGQCFGISAAGKVLLALIVYQIIMLFISLCIQCTHKPNDVYDSEDTSAELDRFHGSYGLFKLLGLLVITIVLFVTVHWRFFETTMSVWFACAGLFVIYQVFMFVEFSLRLGDWFTNRLPEESEPMNGAMVGGLLMLVLLIGGLAVVSVTLFVHYTHLEAYCSKEVGLLVFNLLAGILVIIASMSQWARDKRDSMGLIQSSVCTAYASYLLISGYMSTPESTCYPFPSSHGTNIVFTLAFGWSSHLEYRLCGIQGSQIINRHFNQ